MATVGSIIRLSASNLLTSLRSFRQAGEERTPLLELEERLVEIELGDRSSQDGDQASAISDPNTHLLDISPFKWKFLEEQTDALKELTKSLVEKGFASIFHPNTRSVQLIPVVRDDVDTRGALKHIDNSVVEMDVSEEELAVMDQMEAMGMPKGVHIPGTICVLMVKVGEGLKIVGLKNDMTTLGDAIDTSMKRVKEAQEHVFTIDDNTYEYMKKYKLHEINSKLKNTQTEVKLKKRGSEKNSLILKGMSPGFEEAHAIVTKELEAVKTFELKLGAGMNMVTVSKIAEETRSKYNCSINYKQNFDGHREASTDLSQTMTLTVKENKTSRIHVVTNAIETQEADIIVNTTDRKLDLSSGEGVSSCILKAAGPSIQEELNRKYPTGIQHGEVAESGPGRIKTCKTIFHGALPFFREKSDTSFQEDCYKWLISLVFHCIIKASSSTRGYRSIAFPALGTGALDYPVQHVVQLMYRAIKLYNEQHLHPPIRDVYLVIFPDTRLKVKQLFFAHKVTHHLKTRHVGSVEEVHKEKRRSDTNPPKYELRVDVGDTLLQVVNGEIERNCEVTDAVLVLWTNADIRASANPGLTCTNRNKSDWKLASFLKELPDAESTADSTNLPGTTLIHAHCRKTSGPPAVDAVVKGIKNAAKLKCTTLVVTLPADGQHADEPRILAEVVFNAMKKAQSKLYRVTVVIEDEMAFTAFGEKLASMTTKFLSPASVDKTPLATELWEGIFSGHAARTYEDVMSVVAETTADSVLLITSNSEPQNREAAEYIKRLLNERLPQNIQETIHEHETVYVRESQVYY